jgi:hypothetical protein
MQRQDEPLKVRDTGPGRVASTWPREEECMKLREGGREEGRERLRVCA